MKPHQNIRRTKKKLETKTYFVVHVTLWTFVADNSFYRDIFIIVTQHITQDLCPSFLVLIAEHPA